MNDFLKYFLKRLFFMLVTLWLIATITFFLSKMLPGTPYTNAERLSPDQIALLNKQMGLDKPVIVQYGTYLKNLLQGDFGISFQFKNQPVAALLAGRVGPSLQLGIQAILLGTLIGIILGTISAMKQNTWVDTLATLIAILGRSIPNFVFAVLLQYVFAIKLHILPIAKWEGFAYTILPTIALAMSPLADSARFIRTEMVEVMHSDYVELARAKGLSRWEIAFKHGLRNSLIPLMTLLGPLAVALMTGSLVVENIFAIPGIGEQFVKSITTNDYPTIMAVTVLYSAMLIIVILVVDLLYGIVDPRIRVSGGSKG
ncbi:oligopeptide ABC transporter permease [Enterococcus dispar]|uniref:Oligopeptide ABC transporter, membrane protein n=2 Tax=Enterococcus TaxID=1350 RepID=S0K6R3_9ENTE|nr:MULTISPECIES: oligopeptide ABC transporter permease [Enterococcus]EOT40237.1 oligopeptide ABC transporter, membrane protein [Enterococcus dispar ATCC 51266]EOW86480.1 oligopeptide ABC transporter, membrane protein [Enterococcus dispar ATCC 51266]MCU7357394.1 ABC transporter permease [Enterococcus dispar]MDT2706022.1 ABC transporter permease [Enterococcus dispar]WCG32047.1 ABC transporter permease [Enterococcus dispar]